MSATYETFVVAGVRVSDIFEVQKREKVENKFNRDTGKPETIVTAVYVPVLCGRDVPDLLPDPGECVYCGAGRPDTHFLRGLDVFSTGIDAKPDFPRPLPSKTEPPNPYLGYKYDKFFVGVRLNKPVGAIRPYETPQVFELRPTSPEVTAALKKAHEELRKLGFTSEPKLYVIKYLSY